MPGLVPGIHVFLRLSKTWMAGPSPAMTSSQHSSKTDVDGRDEPGHDESKDVGGRTAPSASWPDTGVRKHAVLWTAMPGHDALPPLFVMPALVAGIHVFTAFQEDRRRWPRQAQA